MTTNVSRLAELLDVTDSDDWRREDVGGQARFVARFLDDDGPTELTADLRVTLSVDVARWAAYHGCGTPEEARAHFANATHPEAIADGLNQLDAVQIDDVGFDVAVQPAQPATPAPVREGRVYVDRVVRVAVDAARWSNHESLAEPGATQADLARYVDNALTAAGTLVPLVEDLEGTMTVMAPEEASGRDERGDWWTCSLHGGAVTQDCACSPAAGAGNLAEAGRALWEAGHPDGNWENTDAETRAYMEKRARTVIEAYHGVLTSVREEWPGGQRG